MSSTLVIPGFSKATPEELAFLDHELAPERDWYKDTPRFASNEDIEIAYGSGELVEVTDNEDLQLTLRFKDKRDRFKPYLTGLALDALHFFGNTWRTELPEDLAAGSVRLAVTSMVRSEAHQRELSSRGTLAVADSTHCAAGAFDVDAAGYYIFDEIGKLTSQGHPDRQGQQTVQRMVMDVPEETIPPYEYEYDARITSAAIRAAQLLQDAGVINLVQEFQGTPNACLHMAANPNT